MKWVTRTFPGVDRTASAWLIRKFIDPQAEFSFINWPEEELRPDQGIPFDIRGVEHGHRNGKCTFEVIVDKYSIDDPYVRRVAEVVHAADIKGELEKAPEASGIKALFDGLRFVTEDDHETLEIGMKVWEALYTHFKLEDLEGRYEKELEGLSRSERLRFIKEALRKERQR